MVAELALVRALRAAGKGPPLVDGPYPASTCPRGGGAGKVVYIAPMKALVRERVSDWRARLAGPLGIRVAELTGDTSPGAAALAAADVVVTTPEKWDAASRGWSARAFVRDVRLVIIDEVHLLGGDRGPVLEAVVARARHIAAATAASTSSSTIRFVALSTALANAADVAAWLGVPASGLFNFRPSVRPVPLECHIQGYPGRFYCPRMAAMNKPAYAAIKAHCGGGVGGSSATPPQPALVFVASRRQTRLTALDLIAHAAADDRGPRQWLHMPDADLDGVLPAIRDPALRHTLRFGVGLHHAGLGEGDRVAAEALFRAGHIQVLVATATLAWGVNTPAHLVIVKGTEIFDARSRRYEDMPVTDVLQMVGRAGRPGVENRGGSGGSGSSPSTAAPALHHPHHAVAVVMVHEPKKDFYKKFLYEPFPVESALVGDGGGGSEGGFLADALNAEVASGALPTRQAALDWLTWSFYYRRLLANPAYYGCEGVQPLASRGGGDEDAAARTAAAVSAHASGVVEGALCALASAGCVLLGGPPTDPASTIAPTPIGRIAAKYCLRHATARLLSDAIREGGGSASAGALTAGGSGGSGGVPALPPPAPTTVRALLRLLVSAPELGEVPVRHNEGALNARLAAAVQWGADGPPGADLDSPATKASLLAQSHFGRVPPPIADYTTDARGALDALARLGGAALAVAVARGAAREALAALGLAQCLAQGVWPDDPPALQLPGLPRDREGARAAALAIAGAAGPAGFGGLAGPGGAGVAAAALAAARLPPAGAAAAATALRTRFPAVDLAWAVRAGGEAGLLLLDATLTRAAAGGGGDEGWGTGRGPGVPVRAFAPRSVAPKEEGWWVLALEGGVAGLEGSTAQPPPRLLAAARLTGLSPGRTATARLSLRLPATSPPSPITLALISDCYTGLDLVAEAGGGEGRGAGGRGWSASAAAAGATAPSRPALGVRGAAPPLMRPPRASEEEEGDLRGGNDEFDDGPGGCG